LLLKQFFFFFWFPRPKKNVLNLTFLNVGRKASLGVVFPRAQRRTTAETEYQRICDKIYTLPQYNLLLSHKKKFNGHLWGRKAQISSNPDFMPNSLTKCKRPFLTLVIAFLLYFSYPKKI